MTLVISIFLLWNYFGQTIFQPNSFLTKTKTDFCYWPELFPSPHFAIAMRCGHFEICFLSHVLVWLHPTQKINRTAFPWLAVAPAKTAVTHYDLFTLKMGGVTAVTPRQVNGSWSEAAIFKNKLKNKLNKCSEVWKEQAKQPWNKPPTLSKKALCVICEALFETHVRSTRTIRANGVCWQFCVYFRDFFGRFVCVVVFVVNV